MEVMRDGEELIFLYQLIDGHANSSYACHVAALAGIPEELVKRGSEVSAALIVVQCIHEWNRVVGFFSHGNVEVDFFFLTFWNKILFGRPTSF